MDIDNGVLLCTAESEYPRLISPSDEYSSHMMDHPALDYINEMLMDESMEDRTFAQQDCMSYKAIVDGFYEILGEHSRPVDCCRDLSPPTSNSCSSDELAKLESPTSNEDTYADWIYQFLNSNPSSPECAAYDSSSEGHVSFVKNKDLNVEADYENLYVGNGHTPPLAKTFTETKGQNGKGVAEVTSGKKKGKRSRNTAPSVAMDLKELLVSCAQAVSVGDGRRAAETLHQLRKNGASPYGTGLHRVTHYFCEALEARLSGSGSHLYAVAGTNDRASAAKLLKAFKTGYGFIPYFKIAHYFANQSILKAAEGASSLHIIDYGILYGIQWPYLINALADRKGGPPKLIITGIEYPQPGANPAEGIEDIGKRLTEYAKTYRVPFEYHAIAASQWEDVDPTSSNNGHSHEVLVVNCMNRMRHVLDECVITSGNSTTSHRQMLLDRMHSLNPSLFVVAVVNATHSSPFFVSRFRDALHFYSSKFDMVDTTWGDDPDRMCLEKECFYRDILNVVACEDAERVERPEGYKQWQARIQRAGFEAIPIMPSVLSRSKSHVHDYYHRDFTVDHDSNRWMLLSWRGRTTEAISAWKPMST